MALEGFNMDVASAIARGLGQQGVEHADDRRVVRGFQQVFDGRQVLHHAREVGLALHFTDHRCRTGFALGIGGADALHQLGRAMVLHCGHRVFAHYLAQAAGQRGGMHMQRELIARFLQQHLLGARKRIRQGVAHISF